MSSLSSFAITFSAALIMISIIDIKDIPMNKPNNPPHSAITINEKHLKNMSSKLQNLLTVLYLVDHKTFHLFHLKFSVFNVDQ